MSVLPVLLAGLAISLASSSWANYQIVLEEATNRAVLDEKLANLKGIGYESFEVVETPDANFQIASQPVRYKVDLLLAEKDLRERGFRDAKISSCESAATTSELIYPVPSLPFKKEVLSKRAGENAAEPSETLKTLSAAIAELPTQQAIEQARFVLASKGNDDPEKGVVSTRLGYLLYRQGDKAKAAEAFLNAGNGTYSAPLSTQKEALLRYARIKQGQNQKLEAYLAFRQIYEIADDDGSKSQAAIELAGLVMEYAKDLQVGTLDEAQEYIGGLLGELPSDRAYARAMLRLMHSELYNYKGQHPEAIEALNSFITEFQGTEMRRQVAMARNFLALSYEATGDYESAKQQLLAIIAMELTPDDTWKAIPDPKRHAAEWLLVLAKRHNSPEDIAKFEGMLAGLKGE